MVVADLRGLREVTGARTSTQRRALIMLAIGALAGVSLGIGAAKRQRANDARAIPADAIAIVNGKVIREAEYARVLEAIASDRRGDLTESDRKLALDRLIEQELLIQHGVALGVVDSDRAVRETIVREMLASITADAAGDQPSEDQLRSLFAANRTQFSGTFARASQPAGVNPGEAQFERTRSAVEQDYRLRAADRALRDYLGWLRSSATIVTARELPR